MSETTSAATGRCFGIQRVCQVWERSRSALYARRARAHRGGPRNSDRLLRWDPDPGEGVWHATKETELSG